MEETLLIKLQLSKQLPLPRKKVVFNFRVTEMQNLKHLNFKWEVCEHVAACAVVSTAGSGFEPATLLKPF